MNGVHEPSARQGAAYARLVDTSLAGGAGAPRQWHPAPGQLVSLWDMLDFDARDLYTLLGRIAKTNYDMSIRIAAHRKATPPQQLVIEPEQGKELVMSILEPMEKHCLALALDSAQDQIARTRTFLATGGPCSECVRLLEELYSRVMGQLKRRYFLYLPLSDVDYFTDKCPFGRDVADALPGAAYDIEEASKCYATDRHTACVFHLMRVMELGVAHLAKALMKAKIDLDRPWGAILGDIDAAIKALPGAKHGAKRKDKSRFNMFSEAAAHLRHVKNAWRDTTMHPKRTYTKEEAKDLLANVKSFVQSLVSLR
jgi:hypothetical protein